MKNLNKLLGKVLFLISPIIFFISCNSSDENTTKNNSSTDTVIIKQMQFNPAVITAAAGDTIVWINQDIVDHNVTQTKKDGFYSDTLSVGESWKMAVKDSASYICSLHPSMTGKIMLK